MEFDLGNSSQGNKMMRLTVLVILASCVCLMNGRLASAQSRTKDGATVGGIAGAVIGGIIGKQNDETPEGVLIGGAVGALTGGLLGKQQDDQLARQRYYQQQAYQQQAYYAQQQRQYAQQQQIAQQPATPAGISANDIVQLTKSGLSETLILNQLQSRGVDRRLEVSEIIALHQQGVSDNVLTAMQSAPLASQVRARKVSTTTSALPASNRVAPAPAPSQPYYLGPQRPSYQPSVIIQQTPVIYSRPIVVDPYCRPVPSYSRYYGPYRPGINLRVGF